MSERLTTADRIRRLHALERAADEQREQMRLQTVELISDLRNSPLSQNISRSIQRGRDFAQVFSAFGQSFKTSAPAGERSESKRAPFPWSSALSTVGGLYTLFRWWKQNHRRK